MLTRVHIAKLWKILTVAFGQNWTMRGTADTDDIWLSALKDLSPEEFERGLLRIVQSESPFPPALGQFRSWCRPEVVQAPLSPAARAQLAWQLVLDSPTEPSDPLTHQALRAFGGWVTFCRGLTYDNMPFQEKRFISHYLSLMETDFPDQEKLAHGKGKPSIELA